MEVLLLVIVAGFFYFIPTIVGWNKRNASAIFMLNLFLGWSLIGWVVALVWATTKDSAKVVIPPAAPAAPSELEKLASLRSQGLLSDAEFQRAKDKLLGTREPS